MRFDSVQFKKGLIPFKQVACALLLNDAKLSDYIELKNVLIEMGVYFQIQVYSLPAKWFFCNLVINFLSIYDQKCKF